MGLPKPTERFTPQEYYQLEQGATYRSEFYQGEIFAMAGGTAAHSRIVSNLIRELGTRLADSSCTEYDPNMRLLIKATGLRTYPDVSVYCGPMEYDPEDAATTTATNPTVLFEVLSDSTEKYDRDFKAANYRRIESLRAYVLLSQKTHHAEIFERQPNDSWTPREERGENAVLTLPAIGVELPIKSLYYKVEFIGPPAP